MRPRRSLAWPAVSALAPLAVALAFRGSDATLAWRDEGRILAPVRPLVADALRHGRLPLWNPYVGTGAPLLGDSIHGVLHPLSIVAAWLGDGVDLLLLFYLAAAGLGGYLAARAFGASRPSATAAAIAYGASGVVLGTSSLVQCLPGAAMLPWVAAGARRAGEGAPYGVPFLAGAMASMILGGDVQAALLSSATSLVIAVEIGGRRGALRTLAALGLGYLSAGIQILPSWGVMQRSVRVHAFDEQTLHQWALHPWRVLELVVPGLVGGRPGRDLVATFVTLERETRFALPFLPSVFVGAPILAAAAAGVRTRSERTLAALAAVLLWVSLGHRLGAQQALSWVPIWSSFRYAEKVLPHVALLLALLAAKGADALSVVPGARRRAAIATLILAGGVTILVEVFIRTVPSIANRSDDALRIARQASAGLAWFLLTIAVTGAWLLLSRRRSELAPATFAAVALAQGALSAPHALLALPLASIRPPPALEAPSPGPRIATPPVFFVDDEQEQDALARLLALESAGLCANYNARFRIDNIDVAGALFSRRFEYLWTELGEDRWRHFRRYGVTHVAVPRRLSERRRRIADPAIRGGEWVGDNEAVAFHAVPHRPWASFVTHARAVPKQGDTLAATREEVEADSDTVVLEAATVPALSSGRVLGIDRRPEWVTIDAEAEGDALLVVNDAYFPGWTATIDGAPAPILPADVLVRAIPFPAGRHRLEMRYAPREVRWGAAASFAGLLCVAVLLIAGRVRSAQPL